MSERNYGAEIDALRNDITEINELLKIRKPVEDACGDKLNSKPNSKLVEKIKDMTSDTILASLDRKSTRLNSSHQD